MVVLILGSRYGDVQSSGLSATHEEYREARDTKSILAFVERGGSAEPRQVEFIKEVQAWNRGLLTETFQGPDDLYELVIAELHRLELAAATGPPDERELLHRAEGLAPERRSFRSAAVSLTIAGGPRQQLLRPAEIERPEFGKRVRNAALTGDYQLLDAAEGTDIRVEKGHLLIEQESASILMDQLGSIRIIQPTRTDEEDSMLPAIIEEHVQERLAVAMHFAAWILDEVDPRGRLTHVVPRVGILGAGYAAWRTRAEHDRNRHSGAISMRGDDEVSVTLTPAIRHRSALRQNAAELAEDFIVLLRREFK